MLYVGTSGFSYTSWRGAFYPSDARPRDFLRLYAARLPSVELNATFYQLPSEERCARWADATPPGFRFAVKMSRRITHFGRLESIPAFCERVRALEDKLGPILVQFPPGRTRDDGFLRLFLDSLDRDLEYAFEFRHPSWDVDDVLAAEGLARVGSLAGGARFRYLRLREPPYTHADLAAWAARLRPLLAARLDVYVYFKHEDEPRAPAYAATLGSLVEPGHDVSAPSGPETVSSSEEGGGAMVERDPEEALDAIGEKRAEGEEPTDEERKFLEAERVPLESDERPDRSDEGRGTPTY